MAGLGLALRLARREFRGGLKGFRVFLACLTLGVAAIAGVGSSVSAMTDALQRQGRSLLGGDVEFRLTGRAAGAEEAAWLARQGTVSVAVELRAMGGNPAPGPAERRRTLIELKAVDQLYPLFGHAELAPAMPVQAALAERDGHFGALVDEGLLDRLELKPGDTLRIGQADFTVRGVIKREPDRSADGLILGPRVMIAAAALPLTGLVQQGSLVNWAYRLAVAPGQSLQAVMQAAGQRFPDAGWKVTDAGNGTPGLRQWIDRLGLFLTLVGLSALLVGGVGVGNGVKSYLDGRLETIATLKCLGASRRLIFQIYLAQVLILALVGVLVGAGIGALVPLALEAGFGDSLPVVPAAALYPAPLARAAAFGLLTALAFSLWPLAKAGEVPAAGLFRTLVAPSRRLPPRLPLFASVGAVAALALLAVATASDQRFALGFVAAAAGCFVVLKGAAAGIVRLAGSFGRPRWPALRMALANLRRPGAGTASVVLSLGLGLTLLAAIALIQGNLQRLVGERLPANAPAFFFIDIQPDQIQAFETLARAIPGVDKIEAVPSLRGRIVKLNGQPAQAALVDPGARWALRSDRGLTYASRLPAGSTLVSGAWWPADYRGPPLVSLDGKLAEEMHLGVGDSLTVNLLGRDIEARIANLRRIDWGTLDINFVLVFAPGTLEAAPHSYIATAHVAPAAETALYRAVTTRFDNVSAIRVRDVLTTINGLLANIGQVIKAAAGVTLLAGVLVLAGALAAGQRHRVYEAVILKVLGATRADILRSLLLEYALLGLIAGLFAAGLGWAAAWVVVTQVMGAPWLALPATLAMTVFAGILGTLVLGLLGTIAALSKRPAPVLRTL